MKRSSQKGLSHPQTIPNPTLYSFAFVMNLNLILLQTRYMQQEFKKKVDLRLKFV